MTEKTKYVCEFCGSDDWDSRPTHFFNHPKMPAFSSLITCRDCGSEYEVRQ